MSDDPTPREVEIGRVWNVRGDPAQPAFASEAERVLALSLPLQPNTTARSDDRTILWLGPTSWLMMEASASARNDFDATRIALNAAGGALFDVSASYVAWQIAGALAPRVLNRSCPLDFHPRSFAAGRCAQSVLGDVNALFYKLDERPTFIVMAARSFALDARRLLCISSHTK